MKILASLVKVYLGEKNLLCCYLSFLLYSAVCLFSLEIVVVVFILRLIIIIIAISVIIAFVSC